MNPPQEPESDSSLTVCLTPADFETLPHKDLGATTCVVFDVLRATSSMLNALENGALAVIPVETIDEALAFRRSDEAVLLAGERHGLRIRGDQARGIDFDLGNSPREFTSERVRHRQIAMTTTNGTRALHACARAASVLVGALFNLDALARHILRQKPRHLAVVCSGTFEEASLEDTLAAGALCERVWPLYAQGHVADSAQIARLVYAASKPDFETTFRHARNARRLLANPELRDDVAFCLRRDVFDFVAILDPDGQVVRVPVANPIP
jgi:2-phosphosulfolactate phosphatase